MRARSLAAGFALAAALFACACESQDANRPYEAWKDDLTFIRMQVIPARITVTRDEYVMLDERFRALAYTSADVVKEVPVDIWQKLSGMGSVVYTEFRSEGVTGECHIQVVHREPYGDLKGEVTILVTGEVELPPVHSPADVPEIRMPLVRAAQYWIGAVNDTEAASDEKPYHRVWLNPYYIAENEVTRAAFVRFLNTRPSEIPLLCDPLAAGLTFADGLYAVDFDRSNYPMTHVTYRGASEFCAWLGAGHRLPTEAEWEFAARGGTQARYYYGGTYDATRENVKTAATTPVRDYPANPYTLYDMLGNVREICSDWYGANYYETSAAWSPGGPATGVYRVLRGGSYLMQYGVRSAERGKFTPEEILPDVGFRPVYSPQ